MSHGITIAFQRKETYSAQSTFALQAGWFAFVPGDLLLVGKKNEKHEEKIENIDHHALPVRLDPLAVSANAHNVLEDTDSIHRQVQAVARNMSADTHDPAVAKDRINPVQRKPWP